MKLTSPWQLRPFGVFSGRKYKRRPTSKHCSILSRHIIRNSAKQAIGESGHNLTGTQSPNASINGFRLLLCGDGELINSKREKRKKKQIIKINFYSIYNSLFFFKLNLN